MLIKCKECGGDISGQAIICPKCGYPRRAEEGHDMNDEEKMKKDVVEWHALRDVFVKHLESLCSDYRVLVRSAGKQTYLGELVLQDWKELSTKLYDMAIATGKRFNILRNSRGITMCKYLVPTVKIQYIGFGKYIWILLNKDGIPIAKSFCEYKGREKARDSAVKICLDISHESIELEQND